jgi:crotonobetainyl-CoA:carnitine CoA-transferase CaiB-like acyl-CoA transferase
VPYLPGPAFGDSLGAMTIAGGIMGALYHRDRTGEALVVDVSLLATGMWAMGPAIATSTLVGGWDWPPARNPLTHLYRTQDGRWLALCCLQAGYYWPILCRALSRPDLAHDPRFADQRSIAEYHEDGIALLTEVFQQRTFDEWRAALQDFPGQWSAVQDVTQVANDPQAIANGLVQQCHSAAGTPFTLVAAPVQFDEEPARPARAPDFNEHGEAILREIGLEWDAIVDLKVRGIVS